MPKEDAAYQAWLEENRKSLESKPETLKLIEQLAADEDAAKTIFRGYLRTNEFNRRLTEIDQTVKTKVDEKVAGWKSWEGEVRSAHERLKQRNEVLERQLSSKGGRSDVDPDLNPDGTEADPAARRVTLPANAVTTDQFNQLVDYVRSVDGGSTVFAKEMLKVVRLANKEGYDVDLDEVHKLAATQNLKPIDAYKQLTQTERDADAKKAEEARIVKEVDKRVKERVSKQPPDDLRPAGPVLATKDFKPLSKEERRAKALQTFNTLMDKDEAP